MQELKKLLQIMSDLRDPDVGCPWDVKQSFKSIAAYTVEEAYEVADAIERNNLDDLKNELGDLLFQVVFHAQMASEKGQFDFVDVVNEINNKLLRRHPHVFGDAAERKSVRDERQLQHDWEKHKENERTDKKGANKKQRILDGIASNLPALRWSEKIQKRASSKGFDWYDIQPVFDKINEEMDELKVEIGIENNKDRIADEMGDILFASVNLARHVGVNPEQALRDSSRKFISRFEVVEQLIQKDGKQMEDCSVAALEAYWQRAKKILTTEDTEVTEKNH